MKPILFTQGETCHCSPYDISQPACSWIDQPAPNKTASTPAAQQMFCCMSVWGLLGAFWVLYLTLLSIIHSFDQWWSAVFCKKCVVCWEVELKRASKSLSFPTHAVTLGSLVMFTSDQRGLRKKASQREALWGKRGSATFNLVLKFKKKRKMGRFCVSRQRRLWMHSDGPALNRLFLPHHREILKFLLHHDTFQCTCETINTVVLIGLEKRSLLNPDWHFCRGSVLKQLCRKPHILWVGDDDPYLKPVFAVFFSLSQSWSHCSQRSNFLQGLATWSPASQLMRARYPSVITYDCTYWGWIVSRRK